MPLWPSGMQGSRVSSEGGVLATTLDTLVAAAGSTNTKGAWVEVDASLEFDCDGFYLRLSGNADVADWLVDIGIGGSGSETVIVPDVLFSGGQDFCSDYEVYVPLPIKAGTRIAARCQSIEASASVGVMVSPVASPFYASLRCGRATSYGHVSADSGGTEIQPGGAAHTKASYSELSAAVTNPISYAIVCFGSRNNGTFAGSQWLVDVAVGAAASEQVIIPNLYLRAVAVNDLVSPVLIQRFVSVKAGERLAARAQCSSVDVVDRLFDISVIGFD